jgi:hypothetical protein
MGQPVIFAQFVELVLISLGLKQTFVGDAYDFMSNRIEYSVYLQLQELPKQQSVFVYR